MVESKGDYDDRIASTDDDIAAVSCSICLDVVVDGERSRAKLKCGHQFHLDCIGSAFNMKGSMQCPNCRTVEKGHWLYANDVAQAVPDDSVHDWTPDQGEPYELTFPELTFSVHWCPFGGLARYRSVPEDMDMTSAMYQWLPEHVRFAEQTAASTVSHSYSTYIGMPALPSAADSAEEPIFNHHWNVRAHGDFPVSHGFPAMDFHYQSWIRPSSTSSHTDAADQVTNPNLIMRPMNDEPGTRPTSSTHSLLPGQGSSGRPLGSFLPTGETLSMGRSHERIGHVHPLILQQSVIPPVQRNRRYYFHGRPSIVPPMISHHDQNGSYYVMNTPAMRNPHEVLHPVPSHIQPWDLFPASSPDSMDLNWPSLHEATGTGRFDNDNIRSGSVWQGHWS